MNSKSIFDWGIEVLIVLCYALYAKWASELGGSRGLAYLALWNIDPQLSHSMTVPERTTVVLSDDNYFRAEASSHEFGMGSRMVMLRMRGKGSCVMTAATLGRVTCQLMLGTVSQQGTMRLSRMVSEQK